MVHDGNMTGERALVTRSVTATMSVLIAIVISLSADDCFAQARYAVSDARMARAGHSLWVARWARPSTNRRYCAYYVGGGATGLHRGAETRNLLEGTWGVDYAPWPRRHVRLGWWHGRKYQDGGGHYEPDHKNHPFRSFFRSGPFAVQE